MNTCEARGGGGLGGMGVHLRSCLIGAFVGLSKGGRTGAGYVQLRSGQGCKASRAGREWEGAGRAAAVNKRVLQQTQGRTRRDTAQEHRLYFQALAGNTGGQLSHLLSSPQLLRFEDGGLLHPNLPGAAAGGGEGGGRGRVQGHVEHKSTGPC